MKEKLFLSLILLIFLWSCQTSKMQSVNNEVITPEATPPKNAPVAENVKEREPKQSTPVDYYAHIKPEHREMLEKWLKTKSYLRPAVEEIDNSIFQEKYKDFFEQNIKTLRESVGQNGYQYYSAGDFNQDGKQDFAVLLVDNRKQSEDIDRFALAIFNAPFKKSAPVYYEENLQGITNSYITFDRVSEKHLFLGKFESDVYCATYYPKKKTYYFKDCFDE